MDEETEALLQADYEIGHFIRERIVPRAVLYFTGEACDVSGLYTCYTLSNVSFTVPGILATEQALELALL